MPSIGWPELLVVLVIALVIFGPKRLPDMGRQLGRGLREFRKATSEIQDHLDLSLEDKDENKPAQAQAHTQPAAATSVPPVAAAATTVPATETPATGIPVTDPAAESVPAADPAAASVPTMEAPGTAPGEVSAAESADVVEGEVQHGETEHPAQTVTG